MSDVRIRFSVEKGVARLTLANPAGYNVMDLQFCQELGKAAIACETNPDVKVILIEAEGDVFSMGGDIHSFVNNKDRVHAYVLDMATQIHIGVAGLRRAPAPVIAEIDLVTQVVDDEKFRDEVERLVGQFANSAPGGLAGLKALFRASMTNTLDDQLNLEARSVSARCADPATLLRLIGFLNKGM